MSNNRAKFAARGVVLRRGTQENSPLGDEARRAFAGERSAPPPLQSEDILAASDDELLSRAIQGDEQYMGALLLRHTPPIQRWLEKKIPRKWRSVLEAEDVMQQTCTDAFLNIKNYIPRRGKPFMAWLHIIAKRNLIETIRLLEADKRGGGRKPLTNPPNQDDSVLNLYEQVARTQSTPSRRLARDEACEAVRKAILLLPKDYARAVQMYDIEGKTIEEVAQALNRTPGAVHMIRLRAIRRLGELLGSDDLY